MTPEEKEFAKKQIMGGSKSPAKKKGSSSSVELEALSLFREGDASLSKRTMGPRKRFEKALPLVSMILKKFNKRKDGGGENQKKNKIVSELREVLSRPIVRAAAKAELDVYDQLG